jgi:hypothetical protein
VANLIRDVPAAVDPKRDGGPKAVRDGAGADGNVRIDVERTGQDIGGDKIGKGGGGGVKIEGYGPGINAGLEGVFQVAGLI